MENLTDFLKVAKETFEDDTSLRNEEDKYLVLMASENTIAIGNRLLIENNIKPKEEKYLQWIKTTYLEDGEIISLEKENKLEWLQVKGLISIPVKIDINNYVTYNNYYYSTSTIGTNFSTDYRIRFY